MAWPLIAGLRSQRLQLGEPPVAGRIDCGGCFRNVPAVSGVLGGGEYVPGLLGWPEPRRKRHRVNDRGREAKLFSRMHEEQDGTA